MVWERVALIAIGVALSLMSYLGNGVLVASQDLKIRVSVLEEQVLLQNKEIIRRLDNIEDKLDRR